MLAQLKNKYPQDVRIVYRHFPLISIHDKAALSAQAAEAAGAQGKFWEMHDLLFEKQGEWASLDVPEFEDWLLEQGNVLELEIEQFTRDLSSTEIAVMVQAAYDHATQIGLPGTPFLLLNGRIWPNNLPMSPGNLAAIIELDLLERRQFTQCPPLAIDLSKQYLATLKTEKGDIVLELFADQAPLAVNNFIFLAQSGWFDGVSFHRVIPGVVAQAGDPSGTGFGGPGYAFITEISSELKFDKAGVLGMANSGPDSNGSQFFIALAPNPQWDGSYTIFGQVIVGMDVVESLSARDPSKTLDLPPGDLILSIVVEEK